MGRSLWFGRCGSVAEGRSLWDGHCGTVGHCGLVAMSIAMSVALYRPLWVGRCVGCLM